MSRAVFRIQWIALLSDGASSGFSTASRPSVDEESGGAKPAPETGVGVGAYACVRVEFECVCVLSERCFIGSEPARSTPDSSGGPNACGSAIGEERPKAEDRRLKAAERGRSRRLRLHRRAVPPTAPCWAVANTVPRLATETPNEIPPVAQQPLRLLHTTITLGDWRVKARCSGSYRSATGTCKVGSRTSARTESYVGAH